MTTPLDIRLERKFATNGNDRLVTINFRPNIAGHADNNFTSVVSIKYNALSNNPPDEYMSLEDLIDDVYPQISSDLLDTMNALYNNAFHLGVKIYTDPDTTEADREIIASVDALETALDGKQNIISPAAHIADAATDAATNAPTNLNTITTLLGALTGEVNATNAKQNALAAKYNDLATKVNTLWDHLEAQGLQATS